MLFILEKKLVIIIAGDGKPVKSTICFCHYLAGHCGLDCREAVHVSVWGQFLSAEEAKLIVMEPQHVTSL